MVYYSVTRTIFQDSHLLAYEKLLLIDFTMCEMTREVSALGIKSQTPRSRVALPTTTPPSHIIQG
jgi:hypothetical protein